MALQMKFDGESPFEMFRNLLPKVHFRNLACDSICQFRWALIQLRGYVWTRPLMTDQLAAESQFRMDEDLQRWCLDVMERVMKRPCAALFLHPVDEHEEGMSSYYIRIRNPMDLGQIQAKLLTSEYQDTDDWRDDMKLIWTNAERFHGKDSYVSALASELRATFLKILDEEPREITMKSWLADFKKKTQKLEKIIANAPDDVVKYRPTCIQLPSVPKMESKRIQRLVDTSQELTSKEDAREMLKIVMKYEPNVQVMSKDVQMDVDSLRPITMHSLEQYVRNRYEDLEKTFPE